MDSVRLLIVYGGPSEEHDVSVKSARELAGALRSLRVLCGCGLAATGPGG